jgi:hypothetical protein
MSRSSQLVLTLALVATSIAAQAAELSYAGGRGTGKRVSNEPEIPLGYTDLRLGYFSMPTKGSTNEAGVDLDSGSRISLMAIGPICGIIPINCFTEPRANGPGNTGAGAVSWADRDGWNWLGGLELSMNNWKLEGDSANGTPDIKHRALAVTFHMFNLGFQVPCRCTGRLQYEIGPFLGLGTSSVDYTSTQAGVATPTFASDTVNGLYIEAGLRGGAYYTFAFGLQIGAEVRYTATWVDADSNVGNTTATGIPTGPSTADLGVSGLNAGVVAGYRL